MVTTYFTMGPWNVPGLQHTRIGACIQASGPSHTAGTPMVPWASKDCGTKITGLGAPSATFVTFLVFVLPRQRGANSMLGVRNLWNSKGGTW